MQSKTSLWHSMTTVMAVVATSALAVCASSRPVSADPVPRDPGVTVFVAAQALGQDLVRVQLELARSLSSQGRSRSSVPAAVRSSELADAGVTSPAQLRAAANDVRAAEPSPAGRGVLASARQIVALLYPAAPSGLGARDVAAMLDAAASDHDRLALIAATNPEVLDREVLLSALRAGEMVWRGARPLAAPSPLFAEHASVLTKYRDALSAAARAALREGSVIDPSAVAALTTTWLQAGYRRTNAVLGGLVQLHKPYRFASRGPDAFDCSGLTAFAWAQSGLHLKTSSFSQRVQVVSMGLDLRQLRAGDLVFYKVRRGEDGGLTGHVAMALGHGTLVVEAQSNADKVQVAPYEDGLVRSFGRVRLAGERTDSLYLS